MASTRIETAKKYLSQYSSLNVTDLSSTLTDTYIHHFAPASLKLPGPLDKRTTLDFLKGMDGFIKDSAPNIEECIDGGNHVIIWARGSFKFSEDVRDEGLPEADWTYQGEYMFILFTSESGDKITKAIEFVDSKKTADTLMPLMKRAGENKKRYLDERQSSN